MTIEERIEHLANMTFLLDYFDKHGGVRNKWVVAEFRYHNEQLINELKETYDEAGNRKS